MPHIERWLAHLVDWKKQRTKESEGDQCDLLLSIQGHVGMGEAARRPERGSSARALFIVITDHAGGAERVAFAIAAELSRRRGWAVEVKIVCSKASDSFSKRVLPAPVETHYGPARSFYFSFCCLPLRLALRHYDLVFTTHVYTNALVSLMRRLNLLRIGSFIMRESTSVFDRWSGVKSWRFKQLYGAYGQEDVLIAQTGYMADRIRPYLPAPSSARVRVIPNPIDLAAIRQAVASGLDEPTKAKLAGRSNILFCGRLIAEKQPWLTLAAFHRRVKSGSPAQLVFVGDGPLRAELEAQTKGLGLEARVLFLGQVANPFPIMAACEQGLVTSSHEGFPNVILEMMACGVRSIVTTPCAGDLDRLSGVTVTRTFEADEIAAALEASESDDRRALYRRVLRTRGTARYLDELLGLTGLEASAFESGASQGPARGEEMST